MTKTRKIVADSSADTLQLQSVAFASVPMKIVTAEKEYVDDVHLDVPEMVSALARYTGRSSTACPAPGEWLEAFGDAEEVFCVAITSGLSGSYGALCVAKQDYEQRFPGRRVCVIDSLSAGPELKLLLEKLQELVASDMGFEEITRAMEAYREKTALLFMLESMHNLARNGRVSSLVANAAGLLGIRVVGRASDVGQLELLEKCRGKKKAVDKMLSCMEKLGYRGGKVRISHCENPVAAEEIRTGILMRHPGAQVDLYPSRGLCSFYAEKGGLLLGFEKE